MSTFRTLREPTQLWADPIRGSRFLATAAPTSSEEDAQALVASIRAEHPDATHHCWAYRLRGGPARSSDEGEPGGSAGRPILAQIDGHGLVDVVVVVSRWFGGTKLGVGGLVRAYGGTAGKALDRADIATVEETVMVVIEHDYGDTAAVEAVLGGERLEEVGVRYELRVARSVLIPVRALDRVRQSLADRTSGRVGLEPGDS